MEASAHTFEATFSGRAAAGSALRHQVEHGHQHHDRRLLIVVEAAGDLLQAESSGGERWIRTHECPATSPEFESGTFDQSATSRIGNPTRLQAVWRTPGAAVNRQSRSGMVNDSRKVPLNSNPQAMPAAQRVAAMGTDSTAADPGREFISGLRHPMTGSRR